MLGGPGFLRLLVLALGMAMVVGNAMALARPPVKAKDGELARAPMRRTVIMILIGAAVSLWALASIVVGS